MDMLKSEEVTGYIYRPYFTLRNGKRIYASQYGRKAFKIPVTEKQIAE